MWCNGRSHRSIRHVYVGTLPIWYLCQIQKMVMIHERQICEMCLHVIWFRELFIYRWISDYILLETIMRRFEVYLASQLPYLSNITSVWAENCCLWYLNRSSPSWLIPVHPIRQLFSMYITNCGLHARVGLFSLFFHSGVNQHLPYYHFVLCCAVYSQYLLKPFHFSGLLSTNTIL